MNTHSQSQRLIQEKHNPSRSALFESITEFAQCLIGGLLGIALMLLLHRCD